MATIQNTELLNNAFSGLADTIMRQRMAQQENARYSQSRQDTLEQQAIENAFKRQELENQRQARVADTNYKAKELHQGQEQIDQGAKKLAAELKQHAVDSLHETFEKISKAVADGSITPERGNQILKGAASKVPPELASDPLVQAVNDPSFSLTKDDTEPKETVLSDGTKVVHNPKTGQFHVEGTPPKPTETKITTGISPTTARPFATTNTVTYGNPPTMPGQTPAQSAQKTLRYNPETGMVK